MPRDSDSLLRQGVRVRIDFPISDRLHRQTGTVSHAYGLQPDCWWVTVDSYPADSGPLWFRGSELVPLEVTNAV